MLVVGIAGTRVCIANYWQKSLIHFYRLISPVSEVVQMYNNGQVNEMFTLTVVTLVILIIK